MWRIVQEAQENRRYTNIGRVNYYNTSLELCTKSDQDMWLDIELSLIAFCTEAEDKNTILKFLSVTGVPEEKIFFFSIEKWDLFDLAIALKESGLLHDLRGYYFSDDVLYTKRGSLLFQYVYECKNRLFVSDRSWGTICNILI